MVSVPLSNLDPEEGQGRRPGSRGRPRDEASFEAMPDGVPPQNLEAEEAVLGGILLDPDAIGRVADVLQPEAFYLTAHREIYRTALMLHGQGKPTDLTAMTAWLADTGALEKVGGSGRLVELVERTLSTASIDQVARLVMDKFLRRQLIRSGNEVIPLGFDQSKPMEQVLDEAEQKIFAISQEKPSTGLTPTAEILTGTFNEIESRSLGTAVAGIPCNFYDLDAMTQGLQRSDLIIIAGRPAMGKTAITLNLAKNVAQL
ncbi:MAG: DnaB-like helicase N-terminal domain-containing protein, partial [Vulcanococcus sp.]